MQKVYRLSGQNIARRKLFLAVLEIIICGRTCLARLASYTAHWPLTTPRAINYPRKAGSRCTRVAVTKAESVVLTLSAPQSSPAAALSLLSNEILSLLLHHLPLLTPRMHRHLLLNLLHHHRTPTLPLPLAPLPPQPLPTSNTLPITIPPPPSPHPTII